MPVTVDVYFTDDLEALENFTDPDALRIVTNQGVSSVVVQTQPKTRYYCGTPYDLVDRRYR
jgi:hypothetical protein